MDPEVDKFFPAGKYPEFSKWKAEMSQQAASDYVAASQVKETLYHVTLAERAEAIRREGTDTKRSTETVLFAAGHYMARDREYALGRFGSVAVEQKALIKKPREFKNPQDFADWKAAQDISSLPERVHAKFSRAALLEQGYDGLRIIEDTAGVAGSETWLAFHPKQVVSLPKS